MLGPTLHRSPTGPGPVLRPDPAQQRVIDWRGPGVCVVLASPGTGATTTLVESVVAQAGEVPMSRMLVIARDRDAVVRMRAVLARRLDQGALPTVTTFHGLAYSLVRRTIGPGPDAAMPRLLSGAEEDARIRELLRGAIADGDLSWPDSLMAATSTLGFANDLRSMLTRARELGIPPARLAEMARQGQPGHHVGSGESRVPAWEMLGRLAEIDAEVMALEGVVDYSRLLQLAMTAADEWRGDLDRIWVDDFQEAGILQRRLLLALTGPRTSTMVMADPDTAAFGFRGGDRLGALHLVHEAPRGSGQILVLDRYYTGGEQLRAAYASVRRQPAIPGLPATALLAYRAPEAASDAASGALEVLAHDTWGDLAAWVADDLRRLHLADGVGWADMAVIARSSAHLESLRRALIAVGVPVTVAASDIALPDEPAVATIIAAVSAAIDPDAVTDREALELITGPLLGMESSRVRRLARSLREAHRQAHPSVAVPPGMRLVRDLLVGAIGDPQPSGDPQPRFAGRKRGQVSPAEHETAEHEVVERVRALGRVLASVRELAEGVSLAGPSMPRRPAAPAEVLWSVWSQALPDEEGWTWPERLRRAALGGHLASGHDLDAVIALFATAERLSDRYGGVVGIRGLLASLSGQRVAAERVRAAAPVVPAVELMTVHLAVGRSWRHVVIIGAQEGVWPPGPGSSSALRVHEWEAMVAGANPRDGAEVLRDAAAERMAQERRLFALAVSRARDTLSIAVVQSDTEQPSRFVDDIGVDAVRRSGRPPRPLTLDGLVASLRGVAQDHGAPASLRSAAIERLALLADATDDAGVPLVPRADPATWWGTSAATGLAVQPGSHDTGVRAPDRPVPLSGSGLAALQECPLRWFLSRVVRAEGPRGKALAIGSLVHAMAEYAALGEIPVDAEAMLARIDQVWPELAFDAPWESVAERADVAGALERLCAYLRQADPAVAVEHEFAVTIPVRGDVDDVISVRGAIDRIEIDAQGRVHLIDFKTMRNPPSARAVSEDVQLGMYQLAAQHGALDGLVDRPEVAGAALVQLRATAKDSPALPRVQEQPELGAEPVWLLGGIAAAVARVRAEDFPAVVSSACRTCPFAVACPAQAAGREVLS